MTTTKRTEEERNIKRIVLLGSTFVILIVSIIIGYVLISFEVNEFNNNLKTFKNRLILREKTAIKAIVDNIVNDIKYEEISKTYEIKKRIKNQVELAGEIINTLIKKSGNLSESKLQKAIIDNIKLISKKYNIDFFIFNNRGYLLLGDNTLNIEGRNYIDFKDLDGKYFVKKIVSRDGFSNFSWFMPKSNKMSQKIVFAKRIKSTNMILCSSEFLETRFSLAKKISDKINRDKFNDKDFVFMFAIKSLSSSKNFAKLLLEKNIITDDREIKAMEEILSRSDFKGNIYYEYDNKLIYSTFLPNNRIFISAGVDLNSINDIIKKEAIESSKNLNKKIISLIINISFIMIIFFIFSFFIAKKIENMFKSYRLKIINSQQLLIQKSKMAAMGEMIGNIAHQWRQPLSRLSALFFDIESAYDYGELNKRYLSKRIDEANDLTEYMSKTIDDFRDFFNPDIKKENFNLLNSVKQALSIVDSSLRYYKIEAFIKIDKNIYIMGYPNEFSQAILNIISNAKDAALHRHIKNPKISIYSKKRKDKVFLYIEDNCGGIDENIKDKLFEPYVTTKFNYGTGIGLYITKLIIENKMGGKIVVKSVAKVGTSFILVLKI